MSSSAASPDAASTRRTPAATPLSPLILTTPMSPVRATCVPPHSSVEKSPMRTTVTRSPYLSPKNASAPALIASSYGISSDHTSALARMYALVSSSTSRNAASSTGPAWLKSKRSRSGVTSDPACFTCSPSRRRSAAWRRCVAE